MRRIQRASKDSVLFVVGVALATVLVSERPTATPSRVGPHVVVYEADRDQIELARWAVGRFEEAGLEVPTVEIHFHGDDSGCHGHLGFAIGHRVDVCTVLVNEMARRNLLHEMSHVWLDEHLSLSQRRRFLSTRGLWAWNRSSVPWNARGFEQGAEIVAWGLGNRILMPQIPDNDPSALAAGFEILTGLDPPRA
jgi:hypothetical protein